MKTFKGREFDLIKVDTNYIEIPTEISPKQIDSHIKKNLQNMSLRDAKIKLDELCDNFGEYTELVLFNNRNTCSYMGIVSNKDKYLMFNEETNENCNL